MLRARTNSDRYGDQSGDDGKRGHQDGPEANAIRLDDRIAHRHPFGAQSIRVVHLQDAVLFYDAEQQKHSQGAPQAQGASGDPK